MIDSAQDVLRSLAKKQFELQPLLMVIAASLGFHLSAVEILKASPLSHPELLARSVQSPLVLVGGLVITLGSVMAGAVARWVLWQVRLGLLSHWWPLREPDYEDNDCVRLEDALKCALLERDTLWIERIEKEEARQLRWGRARVRTHRRLFACLLLFIVDFCSPESAFRILARPLGIEDITAPHWVLFSSVLGVVWCWLVLGEDDMLGWIWHPELIAKRRAESLAAALARQAFLAQVPPPHTYLPTQWDGERENDPILVASAREQHASPGCPGGAKLEAPASSASSVGRTN